MGGNKQAPAPVGSIERVNLDPAFGAQLRQEAGNFLTQSQGFQNQANQAANQFQTNYGQFAPQLQTGFQQFTPQGFQTDFAAQPGIDARTQGILALAQQQRQGALNAQQRQIARQFGAQSPGTAAVLQQQAANRSALQANPLLFQATEAQAERQRQEQQLKNAALLQQAQQGAALQQLGNQAQLQQTEAGAMLQGASNQAQAQRLALQAQPLQAQQNILATLSNLGQLYGTREAAPLGPAGRKPRNAALNFFDPFGLTGAEGGVFNKFNADTTLDRVSDPFGLFK